MPATDLTTLIADGQAVATPQAAAADHCTTILGCHARQKAVLSAARNAFGLPCSLGHRHQPHTLQRWHAYLSGIPHLLVYATAAACDVTFDRRGNAAPVFAIIPALEIACQEILIIIELLQRASDGVALTAEITIFHIVVILATTAFVATRSTELRH